MAAPTDRIAVVREQRAIGVAMAAPCIQCALIKADCQKDLSSMKHILLFCIIAFCMLGCSNKLTIAPHASGEGKSFLPYAQLFTVNPYQPVQSIPAADTVFAFYCPLLDASNTSQPNNIALISPQPADSIKLLVLVRGNTLFLTGDQDFNGSFSNDTTVALPTPIAEGNKLLLSTQTVYPYFVRYYKNGMPKQVRLFLKCKLSLLYNGQRIGKLHLNCTSDNESYIAAFKGNGRRYYCIGDNLIRARLTGYQKDLVYFLPRAKLPKTQKLKQQVGAKVGETVLLGKRPWLFTYQSADGDTVQLQRAARRNRKLAYDSSLAPAFEQSDIQGNYIRSDSLYQQQLTLLHFWGWWCLPCLANIPNEVSLYQQTVGKGVHFIGIAVDRPETMRYTREEVDSTGMVWPQLFSNLSAKGNNELHQLFKIDSYPTYILIDRHKKIIYRGSDYSKVTALVLQSIR
jgi:thiol-disulfide isomerase/thioredoxin